MKNVLKGSEWNDHIIKHDLIKKDQMDLYVCTHRFTPIYKIGGYFFIFKIIRGYKNITSLKKLI